MFSYNSFYVILGFIPFSVMGGMISAQSNTLFMGWVGMEISMLCYFPLAIKQLKPWKSTLGSVHYFLIQAVGSSMYIVGTSLSSLPTSPEVVGGFLFLSLMVKVGLSPCASWVAWVMGGLEWGGCFLISSLQKFGPVFLMGNMPIFSSMTMKYIMFGVCTLSILEGGLMGFNTMKVRELFGWSSVAQSGWMVLLSQFDLTNLLIYFMLYSMISFSLCSVLRAANIYSFKDLTKSLSMSCPMRIMVCLGLLSLAGLPPLSGFSMKWVALMSLSELGWHNLMLTLILLSALNIMMYINLCFVVYSHGWTMSVAAPYNLNDTLNYRQVLSTVVFVCLTPLVLSMLM